MGRQLTVPSFEHAVEKEESPKRIRRASSRSDVSGQTSLSSRLRWSHLLRILLSILAAVALLPSLLYLVGINVPSFNRLSPHKVLRPSNLLKPSSGAIFPHRGGERPLKVYIYPLPDWLDSEVRLANHTEKWLTQSSEYDADLWMYNFLSEAPFRTRDPNEATLFYIPIFPTRRLHLKQPKVGWQDAIAASAHDVKWGIHWVKEHWNYWRLNNGADHFTVLAGDHGRCTHMSQLTKEDVGDLFVFQHLGDLNLWNGDESVIHATAWPPQPAAGQYWPCYRPNHDILLPSCLTNKQVPIVSPFHARRELSTLFRFEPEAATANHPYHHVNIRKTLRDHFEVKPIRGADWHHYQGLDSTLQDMANSTLCMIPPGIVAHTSRHWRAMARGCIPVTYFQAYDLPFQDRIDYSSFSLTIQPQDVHHTQEEITDLLSSPDRLRRMQTALAGVQNLLRWEGKDGIAALVTAELHKRSDRISRKWVHTDL